MIAGDIAALAVPVDKLRMLEGNPRRGDVGAVARSLKRFGQLKPIVATLDGTVVAGNHTLAAALELGWSEIAVNWADLDEPTAKAFALADNRTAELGGYDDTDLATLIAEVLDFDAALLADTGWTEADLAALIEPVEPATPSDDVPAWAPAKTARGDIWLLGPHRVMCGDCREPTDVDRLLEGATINLAVTSPPYAEQRDYDPESDFRPIPPDEYVEWFTMVAANVVAHLAVDGSWLVNIKPSAEGLDTSLYVLDLVAAHVREWGWHLATEFCWERTGVPKQPVLRLKNQFEPVYQFTRDRWKFRPDHVRHASENAIVPIGPGAGDTSWDRHQGGGAFFKPEQLTKKRKSNADRQKDSDDDWFDGQYVNGWAYPGNRLPTFAGTHEATGHTAAYPVGLPQFFTRLFTDPGDTIFDPFLGSGSTLLAAHAEDCVGYGMEISPRYVDVIAKRFQLATGIKPIAEATGVVHDFCEDNG